MHSREIVRRAIEFDSPPRLPFWQHVAPSAPDDVWEIWEMDRGEAGWFFDNAVMDDWGCQWAKTDQENMGQVIGYPLEDWSAWDSYRLPDPRNPFYFKDVECKPSESSKTLPSAHDSSVLDSAVRGKAKNKKNKKKQGKGKNKPVEQAKKDLEDFRSRLTAK